jgi:two-component system cell cycle response regulator DivK
MTKILMVEDNADNREIYRTILTYGGYEVVEAADGEEGIAAAREHVPALILMDVSIPKLDGWEATRRLKGDVATRHIPVIALTAHALESDRQRSIEAGCDGYLRKPVSPGDVLAEVRRVLEPA